MLLVENIVSLNAPSRQHRFQLPRRHKRGGRGERSGVLLTTSRNTQPQTTCETITIREKFQRPSDHSPAEPFVHHGSPTFVPEASEPSWAIAQHLQLLSFGVMAAPAIVILT